MKSIQALISSKVLLPSMFWSGLLLSPLLWADTLTDIAPLQHGWGQVNYSLAEDQRAPGAGAHVAGVGAARGRVGGAR